MGKEIRILIAGGGTGGHLFPAIAIGEEILTRYPEAKIHYMGSEFGIEANVLPLRPHPFTLLPIRGLQRGLTLKAIGRNSLLPMRIYKSLRMTKKVFRKFKPQVVIGTGGYASALPLKLGAASQIPIILQEQNSLPGLTNRRFSKHAELVCTAFDEAKLFLKAKIRLTGNPVRKGIQDGSLTEGAKLFKLSPKKKTLFLFGGSQGSRPLNHFISLIIPDLTHKNIQLIWQTGENEYQQYSHFDSDSVRVAPFVYHMSHAYALSDLVVSRAGALTIAELMLCGKPSIMVPFPGAAGDHQTLNAKSLSDQSAAELLVESEITADSFLKTIISIIQDDTKLKQMGEKAKFISKPDATLNIVDEILGRIKN